MIHKESGPLSPIDEFARRQGYSDWAEFNRAKIAEAQAKHTGEQPKTPVIPTPSPVVDGINNPIRPSLSPAETHQPKPTHTGESPQQETSDEPTELGWHTTDELYEAYPALLTVAAEASFIYSTLSVYSPYENYMRVRTGQIDPQKVEFRFQIDRTVVEALSKIFPDKVQTREKASNTFKINIDSEDSENTSPLDVAFIAGEVYALLSMKVMAASRPA